MQNEDQNLPRFLDLETYNYPLPESLIAQNPIANRDESRLLFRDGSGQVYDHNFSHLPNLIPPGSLLVVNSSKVFPCRITGKFDTGGKCEIFLLQCLENSPDRSTWAALGKPLRNLRNRRILKIGSDLTVEYLRDVDDQVIIVSLSMSEDKAHAWLDKHGQVPLPPYIQRDSQSSRSETDHSKYQTVYANTVGSVAAPTAGLHFTPAVFERLRERQIDVVDVVLHVGVGTFMPVKTRDILGHKMHSESYYLSTATIQAIDRANETGKKIISVGTTTLRCLESFYGQPVIDRLKTKWKATDLFIHPKQDASKYRPKSGVGALVTNFHQPKSTLFMLVCALIGIEEALAVYDHAISQDYRFLSYGDACYFDL